MNRTRRILMWSWLLGIGGGFLVSTATAAETRDPRLEKILAEWQERQHWFQTVEYQVEGTHTVPKGAHTSFQALLGGSAVDKPIPPRDLEASVRIRFLLDFERGCHRRESTSQVFDSASGSLKPSVGTNVFNGTMMKTFMPREGNPPYQVGTKQPDMSITSGNMKNGELTCDCFPFFFAHGRIYTPMEPILPGHLRNKPDPEYLHVYGQGVHEERPCLIVRTQTLKQATTSFEEYWVDSARESAIVRFVGYSGKNVAQDINIHYSVTHGHWLPESWRMTVYLRNAVRYYDEMRVKRVDVNFSVLEENFDLEIEPGMLVQEVTSSPTRSPLEWPKNKISVYRVTERGQREDIRDPFHRPEDEFESQQSQRLVWLWIVLALVTGSVGIFWVRYRKSTTR